MNNGRQLGYFLKKHNGRIQHLNKQGYDVAVVRGCKGRMTLVVCESELVGRMGGLPDALATFRAPLLNPETAPLARRAMIAEVTQKLKASEAFRTLILS